MNNVKRAVGLERLLEQAKSEVTVGARYRHYKGQHYHVISIGLRENDLEPCVVYQAEYEDKTTWIRPVLSWLEEIEIDGEKVARFMKVEG